MTYPAIKLKPGRDESVRYGHPWIFSGALEKPPAELAHGDIAAVISHEGERLGVGSYSQAGSIAVRMFDRKEARIGGEWFVDVLRRAEERRKLMGFGPGQMTDGYRVLFGESDGAPGLVVDRYGQTVVFSLSTAGMDKLRDGVISALEEVFSPKAIIERSDVPSRKDEGLSADTTAVHKGALEGAVEFMENGVKFLADPIHGQKTGFFLDQKELRQAIGKAARRRRTLNLFSYTGASSIMAMLGGADSAHNVDSSARALEVAAQNAGMLGIPAERFTLEKSDVFKWLDPKKDPEYDLVIMDPPSIIKSRKDQKAGKKAYHFLNRAGMRLVKDGGLFVTSSCSQFLSAEEFGMILSRAAAQAGAALYTLGSFGQAPDHPVSVHFPESAYLKSFIFQVRR